MQRMRPRAMGLAAAWSLLLTGTVAWADGSQAPMRPLPDVSSRPAAEGPVRYVDATRGDDAGDGSRERPWRTLNHALEQLRPGDTLNLRGGTYYESVTVRNAGEAGRPITLRSHPGELAVIDGGYREFFEDPATAWEPQPQGGPHEFRSTRTYPELKSEQAARRDVRVLGNFGDSLVPLHGYRFPVDFRTTNDLNNIDMKQDVDERGIYCGPGLWYDNDTQRIHVRLSHLSKESWGEVGYRGETDPRKLPLVVGGLTTPLELNGARHVRLHDLVVRGTRTATLRLTDCRDIELDGLTVYGGQPTVTINGTERLRMIHCAVRGLSAPWSWRGSHKYRGSSAYLFVAGRGNRDFEIAWCEFTDSHDGLIVGSIDGLRFHHNLIDNFDDDGVYLTTGYPPGRDLHIFQNYFSRCYGAFSFAGSGKGQDESLASICRNVIDLRRPLLRPAAESDGPAAVHGHIVLEHGSPIYMPIFFYHNTLLFPASVWRNHYGGGLIRAAGRGGERRLFNNIFAFVEGQPGMNFLHGGPGSGPPLDGRFAADGNLHWSSEGPQDADDFFASFRKSPMFQETREHYQPGWTARDRYADPRFVAFTPGWQQPDDLRPRPDSPAVGAGVPLPADWPDPLRATDAEAPDIGALPLSAAPWRTGIHGRFTAFGHPAPAR